MANVVKLYYTGRTAATEWELIPSKLLVVEDIVSYLATKTALTISNFQYVKNELEIGINVDIGESYSQPKSTTNFKYVSIQNDGELIHYYYVKRAIWRSKTCVRFELVMDVLNTFQEGADYNFKKNTRIIREHRNRLIWTQKEILFEYESIVHSVGHIDNRAQIILTIPEVASFSATFITTTIPNTFLLSFDNSLDIEELEEFINDYNEVYVYIDENNYTLYSGLTISSERYSIRRKVDYIPENINPILQCGSGTGKYVEDTTLLKQDWYLLYRNQNNPTEALVNPVECYLIPSQETAVNMGSVQTGGRINASNLQLGKYYYIPLVVHQSRTITLSTGITLSFSSGRNLYVIVQKVSNTSLVVFSTKEISIGGTTYEYVDESYVCEYFNVSALPCVYLTRNDLYEYTYAAFVAASFDESWTTEGYTPLILDTIDKLDRTDAKNIKLIKLPYIPYNFSVQNNKLILTDTDFEHVSLTQSNGGVIEILKLTNLNVALSRTLPTNPAINPFANYVVTNDAHFNASINDLRITNIQLESKIFNSEFYLPKLVYDSFVYNIELEKIDQSHYYIAGNNYLQIEFTMTKTINSKFMFTIKNLHLEYSESNYADCLPIARNNEEVLYNVPYINYIRTGYNYDVKNKNISLASNVAGLGLSALSIGASLLMPSAPLKVAGVVASLVSLATSVKGTITTTIQNENSIKQKIMQTQNQASSISGSDDVDLMSKYAGNRLKYLVYEPTPVMKSLLEDLFFYAGYNTNRLGLPSHNTRVNFDYLECEASLEKISSIPDECMNELINCFKNGITYLHKTSRTIDKWDFEQKYENWEKGIAIGG